MGQHKGSKKSNNNMVEKRAKTKSSSTTKNSKGSTGNMKMTLCTASGLSATTKLPRERKTCRSGGKRAFTGKVRASTVRQCVDPCDNSNDSGLGFDNHMDHMHAMRIANRRTWLEDRQDAKKMRLDIKLENEEVNENFSFPEGVRTCENNISLIRATPTSTAAPSITRNGTSNTSTGGSMSRCLPMLSRRAPAGPITLTSQLVNSSRRENVQLQIISQPEQQHRARYQTEGSRGAVKDRSGNGFPIVQLNGYHKPTTLQVFIGTDLGKVAPHMFYQACRVSGKNSTPCQEKKIDGTVVIEIQLEPTKEMLATCDCVGILKERNVDVEHRFPEQLGSRSKKKSTRCRMIFRTMITHDDGFQETLQVCSHPIVCTQPPGIPEISKKSLTTCTSSGGMELFVLGKNFLKDTQVLFRRSDDDHNTLWESAVVPDKEFLQPTHFVCVVPPYVRPDITEPVTVRLYVVSSGKTSEPHSFTYTPTSGAPPTVCVAEPTPVPPAAPFLSKMLWHSGSKQEHDGDMMPPPSSLVPLRRSSTSLMTSTDSQSPPMRSPMKAEMMDDNSQNSIFDPMDMRPERFHSLNESSLDVHQGDSNMMMINDNSIELLRSEMANKMIENSQMSLVGDEILGQCGEAVTEKSLVDQQRTVTVTDTNAFNAVGLLRTVVPQNDPIMSCKELIGVDLRIKMPIGTVADLVNTNSPSMATLRRFGVTEPNTAPLPNQTAQSIENYLTNLEKPAYTALLAHTTTTTKLDAFVNSAVENHISISAPSPAQSLIMMNKSPLTSPIIHNGPDMLSAAAAAVSSSQQNNALLSQQTAALLSPQLSADVLLPNTQSLQPPQIITTNQQVVSPTISPDVILNAQVSPSIICQSASLDSATHGMLQSQLPITQDTGLASLLSPALPTSPEALLSSAISTAATVSERNIILNAAVDLLATREKINALDSLTSSAASMNQHINSFLTAAPAPSAADVLTQSPQFIEPTFTTSSGGGGLLSAPAATSIIEDSKMMSSAPVVVVTKETTDVVTRLTNGVVGGGEVKKPEDNIMIPPVFATMPTMSESDLINIINPSCFDQGTTFH